MVRKRFNRISFSFRILRYCTAVYNLNFVHVYCFESFYGLGRKPTKKTFRTDLVSLSRSRRAAWYSSDSGSVSGTEVDERWLLSLFSLEYENVHAQVFMWHLLSIGIRRSLLILLQIRGNHAPELQSPRVLEKQFAQEIIQNSVDNSGHSLTAQHLPYFRKPSYLA